MYTLPFIFLSLLRVREVLSTTFCIVKKILYLMYFSGVQLVLGRSRARGEFSLLVLNNL